MDSQRNCIRMAPCTKRSPNTREQQVYLSTEWKDVHHSPCGERAVDHAPSNLKDCIAYDSRQIPRLPDPASDRKSVPYEAI